MTYRAIAFEPKDWKNFEVESELLYADMQVRVFDLVKVDVISLSRGEYREWLMYWKYNYQIISEQIQTLKASEDQHYSRRWAKLANTLLNAREFFKHAYRQEFAE